MGKYKQPLETICITISYVKNAKSAVETANKPNIPFQTAEGSIERHDQELESEYQPIVSVPSVSPETP